MSDSQPSRPGQQSRWQSVQYLVVLLLKAFVKQSQIIATTLLSLVWQRTYASRLFQRNTQFSFITRTPNLGHVACIEEAMPSSSSMPVELPKPPKLDLDEFIATALSATPAKLHPFFKSFSKLHTRKYDAHHTVYALLIEHIDYGTNSHSSYLSFSTILCQGLIVWMCLNDSCATLSPN